VLLNDMRQRETLLAHPSNLIVINDEHSVHVTLDGKIGVEKIWWAARGLELRTR
jgi:hypothetical protein